LNLFKHVIQICKKNLDDEKSYWQQRARLKWLLEGDRNTKFFHISASNRKKKISYIP
jgi:hypothetical protein